MKAVGCESTETFEYTRLLRGNRKIQRQAIVQIDVWYQPIEFQLSRMNTVGCESIWRFQERAPTAPLEENRKIRRRAIVRTDV